MFCVGNVTVPSTAREDELAPCWIVIPHWLLLIPSSESMSAITDSMYNDFSQRYDDEPYLADHTIICPTNRSRCL
jgi:hypothetical protein